MPAIDLAYEARRSLTRIRPQILRKIADRTDSRYSTGERIETIESRLDEHWPRFFGLLYRLYGHHYDFFYYLENIILTAVDCWLNRPDDLYQLDLRRENNPDWYLSERMIGGSLYVDRFSNDLTGLRKRIPYFKELGLTYIHLMPLFASRPGNSDGGYAISDYRNVDPRLGTIDDLQALAKAFREAGISLVLDFVFNHTSDDHEWAIRAQEHDREYMNYFYMFEDRTLPDQYEQTLAEIFPTIRRGNFTWHQGLERWVWTTFNSFQWDLNYANPEVFRAMAGEMLFLANTGVEILRLDAVAFTWKQMGTNCQNLPEAHVLIQAFNALFRIAAPGLVFKSEAIVHPDDVVRYISREECQLSYNPTLMALMWESTATRHTHLLKQSIQHRQSIHAGTAWVNYLRGHDDIGWAFANSDAEAVHIDPGPHRDYLNRFYTGRVPGSFAAGVPFQHNEDTGDMRICGTTAALAGLEQALERDDPALIEMALRRIRMLYGVMSSIGGIPLIFMGEEWGVLNDYTYLDDPDKMDDSRWIHRPVMPWNELNTWRTKGSVQRRIFDELKDLFVKRKQQPALRGSAMRLLPDGNDHTLCYLRWESSNHLVVLANFSDVEQTLSLHALRTEGVGHFLRDIFTGRVLSTRDDCALAPYALMWLIAD